MHLSHYYNGNKCTESRKDQTEIGFSAKEMESINSSVTLPLNDFSPLPPQYDLKQQIESLNQTIASHSTNLSNEEIWKRYALIFLKYFNLNDDSISNTPSIVSHALSLRKKSPVDGAYADSELHSMPARDSNTEKLLIELLPKTYKERARVLLELLKSSPLLVGWSSSGELIINQQIIRHSSLYDLIHYALSKKKGIKSSRNVPEGWNLFLNAIIALNPPKQLIDLSLFSSSPSVQPTPSSEAASIDATTLPAGTREIPDPDFLTSKAGTTGTGFGLIFHDEEHPLQKKRRKEASKASIFETWKTV
jgi:hypothetical protein